MKKPIISVIVPIYNAEVYLKRCLDSLLMQEFKDFEVLLINDGSTDSSGSICNYYVSMDPRFRLFYKENGGVSSARNVGIENMIGQYSIHVDSDDYVSPNYLSKMYEEALVSKADLVYSDYYISKGGNLSVVSHKSIGVNRLINNILTGEFHGSLWNKLLKNNIIYNYRIKFYEGVTIWEDLAFIVNYLIYAEKVSSVNTPLYYYYLHNNNITSVYGSSKYLAYVKHKIFLANELDVMLKSYVNPKSIIALKVRAKEALIINKFTFNYRLWISIYPDISLKDVLFNRFLRKKSRIVYCIAKIGFHRILKLISKF